MAELDVSLLRPVSGIGATTNVPSAADFYNQIAKVRADREAEQQTNFLRQAYAQSYNPQKGDVDYNVLAQTVAQSPYAHLLPKIAEAQQAQAKSQADIGAAQALEAQRRAEIDKLNVEAKLKEADRAESDIRNMSTIDQMRAHAKQKLSEGILDQARYDYLTNLFDTSPDVKSVKDTLLFNVQSAKDQYASMHPEWEKVDLGDKIVFLDKNTKKQVMSLPKGATPAQQAAAEKGTTLTPLQQQNLNKAKAEDNANLDALKSNADELEKIADEIVGNVEKKIEPHPGYKAITGLSGAILSKTGALPNTQASAALQRLETFKGKINALGRQLQSQYGKLGNMAVQEWKIVADSIQNINPASPNFEQQLRDVVKQARDLQTRRAAQYEMEYNETPKGGAAAPAATGERSTKSGVKYTVRENS